MLRSESVTERLTGAHPDRPESRDRDRVDFNFADAKYGQVIAQAPDVEFAQTIAWIRDQPRFPDCVGESIAAYVDSLLPGMPWASAVSIWRDARRRQGRVELIELGTRIEYGIESLVERGWDQYRPGEELDEEEAGKGAAPAGDDLGDEMFAHDTRLPKSLVRYRIIGFGAALLDAIDEALRRGFGVVIGVSLRDPFLSHVQAPEQRDQVLGLDYLGGGKNNHAMRVIGRGVYDGRRRYLIQNSWSRDWGGCRAPDGMWLPGCVWVDEASIIVAHDVHVLQVRALSVN